MKKYFIVFRKPSPMAMVPEEGNSNTACFFCSRPFRAKSNHPLCGWLLATLMMLFANMVFPQTGNAGCIEGDCKNGAGAYVWDSGNKYEGIFKNGRRTGQGAYTFANGDKYVGEFLDGKFHGKGTYTYTDGDVYDGQWLMGRMNGQGVLKRADGTKQAGEFKDGAYVEKWNMNTEELREPDANKYPRGHLEKLMEEPAPDKSNKKPSKK